MRSFTCHCFPSVAVSNCFCFPNSFCITIIPWLPDCFLSTVVINCLFSYFSTLSDLGGAASCLNHKLCSERLYRWNFRSFSSDEEWQENTWVSHWCPVFQFLTEPCNKERLTPASQDRLGADNMDLSVWSIILQRSVHITLQVLDHSPTHPQQQKQEDKYQ